MYHFTLIKSTADLQTLSSKIEQAPLPEGITDPAFKPALLLELSALLVQSAIAEGDHGVLNTAREAAQACRQKSIGCRSRIWKWDERAIPRCLQMVSYGEQQEMTFNFVPPGRELAYVITDGTASRVVGLSAYGVTNLERKLQHYNMK